MHILTHLQTRTTVMLHLQAATTTSSGLLVIALCICDKSQSKHVLGNLYHSSLTRAHMWLMLLLLLDRWLLLIVGCINIINNSNNIIHRCQIGHI